MADNVNYQQLNGLLIELRRSFLQYVGQCWPWTQVDAAAERQQIDRLVARQQEWIARLSDLLIQRNASVDFGGYPTEYTDLHYVALDYLLAQLVENEQALCADLEEVGKSAIDDEEAAGLLEQILASERDNLKELQELAASRAAGHAP